MRIKNALPWPLRIAGPVAIGMSEVLWLLWWLWAHVRHAVRR